MNGEMAERFFIWLVGFMAGLALGSITFGGGNGGSGWPEGVTPPIVPDYVPDSLLQ